MAAGFKGNIHRSTLCTFIAVFKRIPFSMETSAVMMIAFRKYFSVTHYNRTYKGIRRYMTGTLQSFFNCYFHVFLVCHKITSQKRTLNIQGPCFHEDNPRLLSSGLYRRLRNFTESCSICARGLLPPVGNLTPP